MLNTRTAIAANRFGLGARPGDAARIGGDPVGWLERQIDAARHSQPAGGRPESAAVLEQFSQLRLARQAAQSRITNEPPQADQDAIREFGRFIATSYASQARSGFDAAIGSEAPFNERLFRFWQNHFAVSADKQPVGAIAGLYGDEAIRPHIGGNFRDLLRAAIGHPAMLLYLDNQTSIGPNSTLARVANRNSNRRLGLNENLAREILELHTLGVDGGYTQDDVIAFAKCLTGWSIGGQGPGQRRPGTARASVLARRLGIGDSDAPPGEFGFRTAVHEPGPKTILGKRFSEGDVDEGEAVLDFLASRPQTAHFLATKLARHFVADAPPAALVEQLAKVYRDNDGELAPVYRALVKADASWRAPLAKYKTPEDFLISTFRAIGATQADLQLSATGPRADQTRARPGVRASQSPTGQGARVGQNRARPGIRADQSLIGIATELGQRPLTPGSPAGWPDIADNWNGGDALLKRIELATTLGGRIGDRIDAIERLDAVLGETASDATRTGIRRAESGAQAIALLFSAPEFQQR